jgi:hypothetical protein
VREHVRGLGLLARAAAAAAAATAREAAKAAAAAAAAGSGDASSSLQGNPELREEQSDTSDDDITFTHE